MVQRQGIQASQNEVVEWFLTRRCLASLDGSVHTDGTTLCVRYYHIAFWHRDTIYLVPHEYPGDLAKTIRAMVLLGTHGHKVAEMEVKDEV